MLVYSRTWILYGALHVIWNTVKVCTAQTQGKPVSKLISKGEPRLNVMRFQNFTLLRCHCNVPAVSAFSPVLFTYTSGFTRVLASDLLFL